MTSRPFNTSTKNPTSVKLRGLQTSKAVTQQLEVDSRRMEDRLKELKLVMNREKEERESRGSSSLGIWASGQPGAVTTHANDVMKKKPKNSPALPGQKPKSGTKGRKIKVLKDTPIEVPQRPKFKLGLPGGDTQRNFKGPACGQCEEKAVALTCMECGENYCTGCFAKFHMKGALKNHRSVPYRSPTSSRESLPVPHENGYNDHRNLAVRKPNGMKATTGTESHSPRQEKEKVVRVTLKSPPTSTGGTLLQGDYNEAESASSFAAALAEWRQEKKTQGGVQATPGTPRGTSTSTSEGTSTSNGDISPRDIEIKFTETSSLSYADRLLLKKHRRTEIPPEGSPTLMGKGGVAKDYKQKENVLRKSLVKGELHFTDDVDLEDEHQRYMNIFTKNASPEAQEPRPESSLTISEVTEEDEKNIEVSSTYSVQEEGVQPVVEQPNDMQLNSNQLNPQSEKTTSKPSLDTKKQSNTKPPDNNNNSSSKKPPATRPPSTSSLKATTKDIKTSRAQSRSSSSKPRTPQPAANLKERAGKTNSAARPSSRTPVNKSVEIRSGKSSAALRPTSRTSASKSNGLGTRKTSATVRPTSKASATKSDDTKCNTPTSERPVSVGLTTRPSEGLMQVSHHHQQPQHQYKEGLGEFFTVGLTGEERPESREQTNKSDMRSSVTPTNELPECTFQGNSIWRPDSSLAASSADEAMQIPYTPSPPSRSSSRQSSATRSAKTRQVKSPIKQILRNPETGSPLPENGDACNKRSSQGTSGLALRDFSSRASDRALPERSASRIDIEGDDMTGYDEDVVLTHREVSADDKETLEQLTWELASQEGRITADGRITSMSILEEENQDFVQFSHDAELGILQDDGHGSGLSTPCEITMERDELSEEDLQADFEENQACKEEVEALM